MSRYPRSAEAQYFRDCEKEPTYPTRRHAPSGRYRFGLARWLCVGCLRYGECVCQPSEDFDEAVTGVYEPR